MSKPKLLLLCGGQSEEHEVSLASARSVVAAAGDGFEITPLVISKTGQLLSSDTSRRALELGQSDSLAAQNGSLQHLAGDAFDVVFPLLHGPYGEDGSVQGLFKLLGLPFVGSGILGSAVGMDKLMMKAVFAAHGLPQVPYQGVTRKRWQQEPEVVLEALEPLGFPVFVKPANLGSSVGVHKAIDPSSLGEALTDAARFDRRIIVEKGLPVRELEVGILGNDQPKVSPVGEISYQSEFYDYGTKYTEGRAQLSIPADVPEQIAGRCQQLALRAFEVTDAAGLARVDFFYHQASERIYLNEINTMPGFTTTSMYPKLWEAAGVPYRTLVERLVALALEGR